MTLDHESGTFLNVNGVAIYYETLGDRANPPLLLLHGGGGMIEDFNPIIPELLTQFYVIGMDSRGHGRSAAGNDRLSYALLQQDAETLVKHLGIDGFSLLGFSDGGIVGYRMARDKNVNIERLITIGGTWSHDDVADTRELLWGFTLDRWKEVMPKSMEIYQKYTPDADLDTVFSRIKKMWIDTSETGYPDKSVRKINLPVLIVRGDDDHLFPRRSAAKLADNIKGSVFFNIPFASHGIISEQKEIFLETVFRFIRESKKIV